MLSTQTNQLGPYQIREELRRDTFSETYYAYDTKQKQTVALRILNDNLAQDPVYSRHFLMVGQELARLHQENIVQVYDASEFDGHYYIAAELAPGQTLLNMLVRQQTLLSAAEAIAILQQVAAGLDYAASHGLLHTELSFRDIWLAEDGRALLTELGMRDLRQATIKFSADQALDQPTSLSPFASPEQVNGQSKLDARADVYSLGVIAYTMLVGKLPFDATDSHELRRQILEQAPTDPAMANAHIPPQVASVLSKALAKDPNQRYQTAREFIEILNGSLLWEGEHGAVTEAGAAGERQTPAHQTRTRRRLAFALFSMLAIAGLLLGALYAGPILIEQLTPLVFMSKTSDTVTTTAPIATPQQPAVVMTATQQVEQPMVAHQQTPTNPVTTALVITPTTIALAPILTPTAMAQDSTAPTSPALAAAMSSTQPLTMTVAAPTPMLLATATTAPPTEAATATQPASPTATHTATPNSTATPQPTAMPTAQPTATTALVLVPTATTVATTESVAVQSANAAVSGPATITGTNATTPTVTAIANTLALTPTATAPAMATATNTPTSAPTDTTTVAPTVTLPPTETATPVPTATFTSLPTHTPTVAATATLTPTATATPQPTITNTATNTSLPTATATVPPTNTNTPLPTATLTPVPTATVTPVPTNTNTLVPTATATNTVLPTATDTATAVPTVTFTPSPTNTPIPTATATNTVPPTATDTATAPSTATFTETPTPVPTDTPTLTATATLTPTATATPLPTATPQPTPVPTLIAPSFDAAAFNGAFANGTAPLQGRGQPGSTVQLLINGAVAGTTTVKANGSWALTVGIKNPGRYRISVRAVYANGAVRPALTPPLTVVVAAPTPTPPPPTVLPPTATIAPTIAPTIATGRVQLVAPVNGVANSGLQEFLWSATFTPAPGTAFELVFWKAGQNPLTNGFGLAAPTTNSRISVDLQALDTKLGDLLEPGDYEWGILLVQVSPYQRLQFVSDTHIFHFDRAGNGGGGSNPGGGQKSGE